MNMMKQPKFTQRVHSAIIDFMKCQQLWTNEMTDDLPRKYDKYGPLILFPSDSFKHENWSKAGDQLWVKICELYQVRAVALMGRINNDDFRTPRIKCVFGDPHAELKDNGVKYRWNVVKTMFCSGNVTERHRVGSLNCAGETIVDLYAGIGYFTLPYLVKAGASFVFACEWNPDAVAALRENLKLNGVEDRCQVIEGDNRLVAPRNVAHRVNLGLIPSSSLSWSTGVAALLDSGGILYIHENITSKFKVQSECSICSVLSENLSNSSSFELSSGMKWTASEFPVDWVHREWFEFGVHLCHVILTNLENIKKGEWTVSIRHVFKVKQYAPHIDHLVYSVHCDPIK